MLRKVLEDNSPLRSPLPSPIGKRQKVGKSIMGPGASTKFTRGQVLESAGPASETPGETALVNNFNDKSSINYIEQKSG